MNENDHTTLEQAIYEELELTPELIRYIRTGIIFMWSEGMMICFQTKVNQFNLYGCSPPSY